MDNQFKNDHKIIIDSINIGDTLATDFLTGSIEDASQKILTTL